jgi:hypothetical protein
VTPDLGGQVAELQPLRCRPVCWRCSPASGGSLATARAIMTVGTPCPRVSRPGEGGGVFGVAGGGCRRTS